MSFRKIVLASLLVASGVATPLYSEERLDRIGSVRKISPSEAKVLSNPAGSAEVVRYLSGGEGAAISRVRFAPVLSLPAHAHGKEREMLYVLSGGGTMTIGETKGAPLAFTISAGDFVDVPPGNVHGFVVGPDGCEALQIYLPGGPDSKYDGWVEKGSDGANEGKKGK
jgi:quercetin dioxygenase-like cupin family protein